MTRKKDKIGKIKINALGAALPSIAEHASSDTLYIWQLRCRCWAKHRTPAVRNRAFQSDGRTTESIRFTGTIQNRLRHCCATNARRWLAATARGRPPPRRLRHHRFGCRPPRRSSRPHSASGGNGPACFKQGRPRSRRQLSRLPRRTHRRRRPPQSYHRLRTLLSRRQRPQQRLYHHLLHHLLHLFLHLQH